MKMVNWLWKKGSTKEGGKEEEEVDEEDLKKKGFNPEGLEIEPVKEEEILDFDHDYEGFITPTVEEANQIISTFKYPSVHQIFPK